MKKADAEAGIRHLCTQWADLKGIQKGDVSHPSFSEFKSWVEASHYGSYLRFRTAATDVETWFDEEFNLSWRN